VCAESLKRVEIALPACDDEAVLWGASPEATIERLQDSALVAANGARNAVSVPDVLVPADLTAAGDGFNAGYLAARLSGADATEAAGAAHKLAGEVIRHHGTIVPLRGAVVH
jgi:2-dehydro-3-deoxygluconokinase